MSATPSPWRVRRVDWETHRHRLTPIRHQVFVVEQGVPAALELDEYDAVSRHLLAESPAGEPVGTGRLLPDGHIGRVAVLAHWRGQGLGRALMQAFIGLAREQGMAEVVLNAQTHAGPFYEALGFRPEGAVFQEAGLPHQTMRLSLKETP